MLLAHADFYFIHHAYQFTASKGPSVQLVFGFEYSILIIMIVNILIKVLSIFAYSYYQAGFEFIDTSLCLQIKVIIVHWLLIS